MRICPRCKRSTKELLCNQCKISTQQQVLLDVGDLFAGKYEIKRVLGIGACGSVYHASNMGLGNDVALRVISKNIFDRSYFFKAIGDWSSLTSAHTVRVLDYGETEDVFYVACELLEGRSLREELKRLGRLPECQALEIGVQVCSSLSEAHARGVLHLDIRPENIFLGKGIKLLDYGLAPLTETLDGSLVRGTPRYMSPEVIQNKGADTRSDLYSLGVTLYEVVAGSPPFVAEETRMLLLKHLHDRPLSLKPLWLDEISNEFDRLVLSLLEKNPQNRPSSAEDVANSIADILRLYNSAPVTVRKNPEDSKPSIDMSASGSDEEEPPPIPETAKSALRDVSSIPATGEFLATSELPNTPPFSWGSNAADRFFNERPRRSPIKMEFIVLGFVALVLSVMGAYALLSSNGFQASSLERSLAQRRPHVTEERKLRLTAAQVTITSRPTGANVTANNSMLGKTPLNVVVPYGEPLRIQVSATGYRTIEVLLRYELALNQPILHIDLEPVLSE